MTSFIPDYGSRHSPTYYDDPPAAPKANPDAPEEEPEASPPIPMTLRLDRNGTFMIEIGPPESSELPFKLFEITFPLALDGWLLHILFAIFPMKGLRWLLKNTKIMRRELNVARTVAFENEGMKIRTSRAFYNLILQAVKLTSNAKLRQGIRGTLPEEPRHLVRRCYFGK